MPLALAIAAGAGAQTFDNALRLHTEGQSREALAAYRAVARSSAPAEDRAAALNNACVLAGEVGEHAAALAACEEALRLRRTLGDDAAVAETANNLGLALETLGRAREAEARYREALELNRRLGDEESVVVNLGNLGALALGAGRYSEAMRLYREAAALAAAARDAPWAGEQVRIARINEGVVLEKVGEYRQAVALYKQLLAGDDGDGADPRQRASLLVNAGVIYRNLDDAVSALAAFDQAAAIYRSLGDVSGLSNAQLNRALALHLNLGRPRAAEAAYREALALAERSGDRTEQVQDLFYLGRLLLDEARGAGDGAKLAEAEALFRRCLEVAQSSGSAEGRGPRSKGWDASPPRAATSRVRCGSSKPRSPRSSAYARLVQAPWRAGYFGDKRAVYAAAVDVLARLAARQPNAGFAERAFAVVQRAKARDLLDLLGPGRQPAPPHTAAEIDARLGGDVAMEYFVGEGRLHRWVLHDATRRARGPRRGGDGAGGGDARTPRPRRRTRAGRARPRSARRHAAAVAAATAGARRRAAHRARRPASLPALRAAAGRRRRRRAAPRARHRLLPAEQLDAAARGGQARAIARALCSSPPSPHPTSPLPRARCAPSPSYSVARGSSTPATPPARRASAPRSRAARRCSTSPLTRWWRSRPARGASIRLRAAGADDGRLTPPEIAATGAATRLSVLAACRTALVSPRDEGRTLASLTGSFLAAGSPAVVATLWDVGDEATAAFMPQLYAQLARGARAGRGATRAPSSGCARTRVGTGRRFGPPTCWWAMPGRSSTCPRGAAASAARWAAARCPRRRRSRCSRSPPSGLGGAAAAPRLVSLPSAKRAGW